MNTLDTTMGRRSLEAFFRPRNVALIGASDEAGSVGQAILANLLEKNTFAGSIFPVNPKHSCLIGTECYPTVGSVPEPIDLAIVATPAATVAQVIRERGEAHVPSVIIISAGFREIGHQGAELEQRVLLEARRGKVRIIGPNCLGIMNPHAGLNATFASSIARPGHICFLSQSGALCTAILDWSDQQLVGFSSFVSVGSMLDVGWGELLQFFGEDSNTRSILIYMESVGDARAFMSAVREVSLSKPIIIIKPGRAEAGAKAAASHTGVLTGQDDVLDAAIRRCGALRVDTIAELFYLADALDKQPRPRGPNLTIVTNAGGPAVLATDALLREGGRLASLGHLTDTISVENCTSSFTILGTEQVRQKASHVPGGGDPASMRVHAGDWNIISLFSVLSIVSDLAFSGTMCRDAHVANTDREEDTLVDELRMAFPMLLRQHVQEHSNRSWSRHTFLREHFVVGASSRCGY